MKTKTNKLKQLLVLAALETMVDPNSPIGKEVKKALKGKKKSRRSESDSNLRNMDTDSLVNEYNEVLTDDTMDEARKRNKIRTELRSRGVEYLLK